MSEIEFTEFEDELLGYFTPVALYDLIVPAKGKPFKKPCDIPMIEGFCGEKNITIADLEKLVSRRVLEICELKQHNILVVNGVGRGYDPTLTGLVLKNKHGYSEKSENTTRHEVILSNADKRMLERAGIYALESGKVIDVSDENVRIENRP